MKIFVIEATQEDLQRFIDKWALRRAVVVSINAESALNWLKKGLQGGSVFSGFNDEGRYARVDRPVFDAETCKVIELGETVPDLPNKYSRVIAWEILPPESNDAD